MTSAMNFPDVLGAITGGGRASQGVVQMASALRPRVIMAGRPLEMLLLLQNAADVEVSVTAALRLPAADAKKQKGRIIAKSDALTVRLAPAAVGLITLPLATLPDIAIAAGYRIGMDIRATTSGKPQRLRDASGGSPFELEALPPERREPLEALRKLAWSAASSGSTLESQLTVMSGKVGSFADLQPSYTALWTPVDAQQDAYLLMLLGGVIHGQLLPALKRASIFPVMEEYTARRFAAVGYKLQPAEIDAIARYLTYLLESAAPGEREMLSEERARHNLRVYFNSDGSFRREVAPARLPLWLREFARYALQDSRVAQFPVKAIAHFAYDALLRDALMDAFQTAEGLLEAALGSADEHRTYIDVVMKTLQEGTLTFEKLYLPLMMGAIAHGHTVTMRAERAVDVLNTMREAVESRYSELDADSRGVHQLVMRLTDRVAQRYGAMPD